jgi:hypothetical protein
MKESFRPAIVVAAYNRPRSIKRLLTSLQNARITGSARLIISIDNNEPGNLNIKEIAEEFQWPHGPKEVRYQEKHLGLRKHILQCGDLSEEFGSVIILEDDLYVSPYFYEYAIHALEHYQKEEKIGGISLYNQPVHEYVQISFSSIYDSSDVYFLQFPSSLGQAWTNKHWSEFREWYAAEPDLSKIGLPAFIRRWPETSWKKYFCAFLVEKNKYFVFPRFSFTTNFNDVGSNRKSKVDHDGQTPLRLTGPPYRFQQVDRSFSRYDVNLELEAECVKSLSTHLDAYSFELDLYGVKDLDQVKTPYLITLRPSVDPIKGFKRALKPHEMNVICNLEGEEFWLSRVEDVRPIANKYETAINNYKYFYNRRPIGWKAQAYYYYIRLRNKLRRNP